MANDTLSVLAHDLLDSVVTRMAGDVDPLPDRQYVWSGAVAVDCEQVVVALEQLFQGLPGVADSAALQCTVLRTTQLAIYVIRCVPTSSADGTPPSETVMDASGTTMLTDAHVLMRSVVEGYRAGDFAGTCDSFSIVNLLPVGPSGGYGGNVLRVQVQL